MRQIVRAADRRLALEEASDEIDNAHSLTRFALQHDFRRCEERRHGRKSSLLSM
jgi:hypothetical protein